MGKLDPVVKKQAVAVSAINLILAALENLVFVGLGKWDYTVLLGSLWGTFIASLCFVLIGISVQMAMMKDPKQAQNYMKTTYLGRLAVMGLGIFIAIKLEQLNWMAALLPLLFTRVSIAIVQLMVKKEK
ncbi:MAG: ATP synthase subunit I [Oscillospiraceae bacterium]